MDIEIDRLDEKISKIKFLCNEDPQKVRFLLTEISEECTKSYFISVLLQLRVCLNPITIGLLKKVSFDYIALLGLARCFLLAFDSKYDESKLSILVFETSVFFFTYIIEITPNTSRETFEVVLNISKRLSELIQNKKMFDILMTPIKKKLDKSSYCFQIQDKTEMIDELIVKFSSRVVWLKKVLGNVE